MTNQELNEMLNLLFFIAACGAVAALGYAVFRLFQLGNRT